MKRFISRHWPLFVTVVVLAFVALTVAALLPDAA
jgi:hypothetical protein